MSSLSQDDTEQRGEFISCMYLQFIIVLVDPRGSSCIPEVSGMSVASCDYVLCDVLLPTTPTKSIPRDVI